MQQYPYSLSLGSVEPIGVDFTAMLPAGRTIADADAWLTKPDGTTSAVDIANIATTTTGVTVTVGPFASIGDYTLKVLAECTGVVPIPKLPFRVNFAVGWDDDS